MATDNLGITEVSASQSQKEVTINEALNQLDNAGNGLTEVTVVDGGTTVTIEEFTNAAILELIGTPTGVLDLTIPTTNRQFGILNSCGFTVTVTLGSGATVDVANGDLTLLYSDGTDIRTLGGGGGGGGGSLSITAGATTVNPVSNLTVSGGSLSDDGGGAATLTISGGGGTGGGGRQGFIRPSASSVSSTAAACKGNRFTPRENMDVSAIGFLIESPSGSATFAGFISEISGLVLQDRNSADATVTTSGAEDNAFLQFEFSTPVTLTAGTEYFFGLVRTDSTDTFALGSYASTFAGTGALTLSGDTARAAFLADNDPQATDTLSPFNTATLAMSVELAGGGGGGGGITESPYDIRLSFTTTPASSQVLDTVPIVRDFDLPADLTGSVGTIATNPTASFDIDIQDDGVSIGTITISTGGVFSFATAGGTAQTVAAGSILTFVAPATVDATAANMALTLLGTT